MRLVSYRHDDAPGVGVMVDDTGFVALDNAAPDLPSSLRRIIAMEDGLSRAAAAADGKAADLTFDDVELEPVITDPNAIWALALNFQSHIDETGLTTSPDYPHIFLRHAKSHVGHLRPLLAPPPDVGQAFDYEGELAVIIGKPGRHIPKDKAMDHVAGYSIHNEGSVREFQSHNRQFGLGKNFEASGSFGPWMMTPDEFGDPYDKEIITRLNGKERQHEGVNGLIFDVEALIHYISIGHILRPGDVIITGTPGALPPTDDDIEAQIESHVDDGGGVKYAGRVHMKPGDVCEVEITGLGILRNEVEADLPNAYRAG